MEGLGFAAQVRAMTYFLAGQAFTHSLSVDTQLFCW